MPLEGILSLMCRALSEVWIDVRPFRVFLGEEAALGAG